MQRYAFSNLDHFAVSSLITRMTTDVTVIQNMVSAGFRPITRGPSLLIMGIGLIAFIFDTIGGVLFAKFMNLFLKTKINPMIGAAGISAFPMASRVVHKMGRDEDPGNFLLMHAAGANVAGQVGSVIAGGLIMTLVSAALGL